MSVTSPTRCAGMSFSNFASASGVSQAVLLMGVLIARGAILLTRILWGALVVKYLFPQQL